MARAEMSQFGELLRQLRQEAGLSQEELAERAGLSRDAISALERGHRRHPHPQTIRALAGAMRLSDDEQRALRSSAEKPPGARSATPAARSPSSLPIPLTSLVGRQRELTEIRNLITGDAVRLVTLTGPGGIGKTRLALELAHELNTRLSVDVAFVSLDSVQDPTLVISTIGDALGVRDTGSVPLIERVSRYLCDRHLVLLLDNLEHLTGAAVPVAQLLSACQGIAVLATSRAALRVRGEHEYPVLPLDIPLPDHRTSFGDVAANDAVTLFVQRARAVRPDFALTEANAATVVEICARLDGLPLAIELAAARVKVLPPEALLARLGSGLSFLAGGPRDQATRLQSMRAAIAWSYDLLDPDERALFRRLSVFADTFTLESAEIVLSTMTGHEENGSLPVPSVLDGIASLVDKSLLRRLDANGDQPRFGMLSTIQEYGLEQLATTGEAGMARRAHAIHVLEIAEQAAHAFRRRSEQEYWLDYLEVNRCNVRTALVWLDESGDTTSLLSLAGSLFWFWYIRGPLSEGQYWLERSIAAQTSDAPDVSRVRTMVGAGLLAHFAGDDDRARNWLEASLAQSPESIDPWWRAFALLLLGIVAEDHGDYPLAELRFADALALFREVADPSNAALTLNHLGVAAWGMGDVARAEALCEEAVAQQRESRDSWGLANSLGYLGLIAGERGEYAKAANVHRESLQLRWQAGAWEDVAGSLADLAALAARVARPEQAARLFGAATALREEAGRPSPNLPERAVFERAEEQARLALGDDAFTVALSAGRALPREHAVAEALALAEEIARSPAARLLS